MREEASSIDVDIVVLGGGLAGYCAAVEALDLGASVALIEKGAQPGGSSVRSGGSFAFAGTDLQRRDGIEDSADVLRDDLLEDGGPTVDPTLVELYVREQLGAYHWLRDMGVVFDQVSHSGGQSRPRSHGTKIGPAFEIVRARAEAHPRFQSRQQAVSLRLTLTDGGGVVGLETENIRGERTTWRCSATVLATGGFSRGTKPIATFAPELISARPLGGLWNTGDGLYLAMATGADLRDVGEVKPTYGVSAELPGFPTEPTLLNALYRGGIVVNQQGRRFVDESISYKLIGPICLQQTDGVGYQIFDQKTMDQSIPDKLVNNYTGGLTKGYIRRADSIAELAQAVGLDESTVVDTVSRYNGFVAAGHDGDFGRTSLSSGYGDLTAIDTPPYYVYPSTAGLTSTFGGLRVDDQMQVLHVDGHPIRGLLAAGEVVGGFHARGYMSGSSLGKAVIFGRQAAATACRSLSRAQADATSHR